MKHPIRAFVIAGLAAVVTPLFVSTQSPAAALFHEGLMLERAGGKLGDAIFRYERVIAEFPADKEIVPQALFHLALAYDMQKDPRARLLFTRLVTEFPTATPYVTEARTRLAAVQAATDGPFKVQSLSVPGDASAPNVSPDGNLLLYVRRPASAAGATPEPVRAFVRDLNTGADRLLLERKGFSRFTWSPDSRLLAFSDGSEFSPPAPGSTLADAIAHSETQILTVATGEVRTVAGTSSTIELSWSPDSQRLATRDIRRIVTAASATSSTQSMLRSLGYVGGGPSISTDVRLVTIATAESRLLGTTDGAAEFTWSPDGTRMAWHVTDKSRSIDEVHVETIAGGEAQTLHVPLGSDERRSVLGSWWRFKWDARDEILFTTHPGNAWQSFLIPVSGGQPRKICSETDVPSQEVCGPYNQDGTIQVLRPRDSRRMMVRDLATGVDRPLTRGSGEEDQLTWGPDARLITFSSNRDGKWAMYVAPIDRGQVSNPLRILSLDTNPANDNGWSWAPNGRLVIGLGFPEVNVYRLPVDAKTGHLGGEPERLTQDATENSTPVASPDGAHIAYWYRNGQKEGLAVMDADGANERPVIEHVRTMPPEASGRPGQRLHLTWRSADEVLFCEAEPKSGPAGFVIVNIKTGAIQPTPLGNIQPHKWEYLPGRQELWYVTGSAGDVEDAVMSGAPLAGSVLKARSAANGSDRVLTTASARVPLVLGFALSPDAKRVAYFKLDDTRVDDVTKSLAAKNLTLAQMQALKIAADIHLMTIDGTEDKVVVPFPNLAATAIGIPEPLSFSPDGKFLLYKGRLGALRVVEIESGKNWPLFEQPQKTQGLNWTDARWAPDGSILLTGSRSRTEWKAFEGVTYDAVIKLMNSGQKK